MGIIFIVGGVRSGKSKFACQLAEKCGGEITFIATAEILDEEMQERIALHRKKRPSHWKLIEEPYDIVGAIRKARRSNCIIIDCLTLLITNWLLSDRKRTLPDIYGIAKESDEIFEKLSAFLNQAKKMKPTIIIISNEVGMGIVPEKKLGRLFRDISGWANQMVADEAKEVYFMVSGIPLRIKG